MPLLPRVSIITPSYNQTEFIEASILSVLDQDYPDLEHIVMDGGSTDGSADVIRKHSGHLAYWVSQPGLGQAAALNEGIRHATGDILGWLNTDDVYLPGAISKVARFFAEHPEAVMAYGDCQIIDSTGKVRSVIRPGPFSMDRLMARCFLMQTATFFRKEMLERLGEFDTRFKYALDYDMWLRAGLVFEGRIQHLPELLACFRVHAGSQGRREATPALFDAIAVRKGFAARLRSALPEDAIGPTAWLDLERLLTGIACSGREFYRGMRAITALEDAWLQRHGAHHKTSPRADRASRTAHLLVQTGHAQFAYGHSLRALGLGLRAIQQDPRVAREWGTLLLIAKGLMGQRPFRAVKWAYRRWKAVTNWEYLNWRIA